MNFLKTATDRRKYNELRGLVRDTKQACFAGKQTLWHYSFLGIALSSFWYISVGGRVKYWEIKLRNSYEIIK